MLYIKAIKQTFIKKIAINHFPTTTYIHTFQQIIAILVNSHITTGMLTTEVVKVCHCSNYIFILTIIISYHY